MKKNIIITFSIITALILISFFISIWMPFPKSLRLVFGTVYVFFLPGFVASYFFFDKNEIEGLVRFIISLVLSVTLIPLLAFALNRVLGIKITELSSFLMILGIIILSLIGIVIKNSKLKGFNSLTR